MSTNPFDDGSGSFFVVFNDDKQPKGTGDRK
ncbi:MbtH family NRPS accessory protein [Mycobacterium sp. E2699]|nr:MbtH family NRPS accessory protein [Mycobacterium sp. E2699]